MAKSPDKRRSVHDYTVACICPMGVELAAVEGMLDRTHDALPLDHLSRNAYTLGEIGGHNVVVAVMPETGNNMAGIVGTQLLNDFPSVRFSLLIGIGGGVPGDVDIRLGDVVVSQPTGKTGGVVQYDLGKRIEGGRFQSTGLLNKPPAILSANVQKLQSQHRRQGNSMSRLIEEMIDRNPIMRMDYSRPASNRDRLFLASYSHPPGIDCSQCDQQLTVPRNPRSTPDPQVHYGIIGSANVVVKDAAIRDDLRRDHNLLCVEMEAAGLMDTFPCLVIRGICDYADSHKNNDWQPYSAATAAAYMKELLLVIPVQQVSQIQHAKDDFQQSLRVGLRLEEAPSMDSRVLTQRSEELGAMEHILQPNHPTHEQRRVILLGPKGVGKTQLALTYARHYASSYDSIIWLNAYSEQTVQRSIQSISKQISKAHGQVVTEAVCTPLQLQQSTYNSSNTRWLWVFDGYDDLESYDIESYCSETLPGSIIITTRAFGSARGDKICLQPLESIRYSSAILEQRHHYEDRPAVRNALNYEGMNARASQLSSLPILPPESFQWVWSTSFKTWLSLPTAMYWITGKPGSGKSTLMKHLIEAGETQRLLNQSSQRYTILSFFFDYRAGQSTANNEIGLIKWFLSQLCQRFDKVEPRIERYNASQPIADADLHQLLDLLYDVLESLPTRVCAFIDGLDEYTGDYNNLIQVLRIIQDRNSMKMCLASRPESPFQRFLKDDAKLIMQEHNMASVRVYIDHAIISVEDHISNIHSIIDKDMRKELQDRASGVIIWARLAIDEIIRAAHANPTKGRLWDILEKLPKDLEQMYERTFARINDANKPEASTMLFFLAELGGKIDIKVLRGLLEFVRNDNMTSIRSEPVAQETDLLHRLQFLLGSFIDIIPLGPMVPAEIAGIKKLQIYVLQSISKYSVSISSRYPKQEELKMHEECEVRLMHKTLEPYIQRSKIVRLHLPEEIRSAYPDLVPFRLYANAIIEATNEGLCDLKSIPTVYPSILHDYSSTTHAQKICKLLEHISKPGVWRSQLDFLGVSISSLPQIMHDHCKNLVSMFHTLKKVLVSPLMLLGMTCRYRVSTTLDIVRRHSDTLDVRLAVEYGLLEYLEETLRQGNLPSVICSDLLMDAVGVWRDARFGLLHFRPRQVEGVFNIIRSHCNAISVDLLVMLILGWQRGDSCNLTDIYKGLLSMKGLPLIRGSEPFFDHCGCEKSLNHLPIPWCRVHYARGRGLFVKQPEFELAALATQILIEKGADVNSQCAINGTILHRLVQEVRKMEDRSPGSSLDTLIGLAKLGANPNIEHDGETPLQQAERIRRREYLKPTAVVQGKTSGLSRVIKVLKHHKKHGSWPDFAPIIETYRLIGLAKWKVDESGNLILRDAALNSLDKRQVPQNNALQPNGTGSSHNTKSDRETSSDSAELLSPPEETLQSRIARVDLGNSTVLEARSS